MKARKGDIVWVGKNGGHTGSAVDYHIKFLYPEHNDGGCWCPAEAVPFLQSIGVKVVKSDWYSSGLAAVGCYFETGKGIISPRLQSLTNNELSKHLLEKEW